AFEREPCRYRLIDIGESCRFDLTVGDAGSHEQAEVRRNLLLDVEADTSADRNAPHGRNVGRSADHLRQLDCLAKAAEAPVDQDACNGDLARLAPQLVAVFYFSNPLLLSKGRIEISAAWNDGQIEEAAADRPVALIPFHGRAIVVTPCVTRVIERAG